MITAVFTQRIIIDFIFIYNVVFHILRYSCEYINFISYMCIIFSEMSTFWVVNNEHDLSLYFLKSTEKTFRLLIL